MKNIWYVVNIALVALALPGGNSSLWPEKLQNKNPGAIFGGSILLVTPLAAMGTVNYQFGAGITPALLAPHGAAAL
jgi:hypothetical protein